MAIVPKSLFSGTISTTLQVLYTAPSLTTSAIRAANVHNGTASAVSVEFRINPAGGGDITIVNQSVGAGLSAPVTDILNHILEPGGMISALTVGGDVSAVLSGLEYT